MQQLKQGLRDGTLAFCMPAAHAELSSEFLEDFSERILKQDWREVSLYAPQPMCELLAEDSEGNFVTAIEMNYHVNGSALAMLTLWEVMRCCAGATRKS
jgi:hypothetical protein